MAQSRKSTWEKQRKQNEGANDDEVLTSHQRLEQLNVPPDGVRAMRALVESDPSGPCVCSGGRGVIWANLGWRAADVRGIDEPRHEACREILVGFVLVVPRHCGFCSSRLR